MMAEPAEQLTQAERAELEQVWTKQSKLMAPYIRRKRLAAIVPAVVAVLLVLMLSLFLKLHVAFALALAAGIGLHKLLVPRDMFGGG